MPGKNNTRSIMLFVLSAIFLGWNFSSMNGILLQEHFDATQVDFKVNSQYEKCEPSSSSGRPSIDSETATLSSSSSSSSKKEHPVCQILGDTSALSFWIQHLNTVIKASKYPQDKKFSKEPLYTYLLSWITPRLPFSVKSVPRNDGMTARILPSLMDKAWARHKYLLEHPGQIVRADNNDTSIPPPVTILIFGGSVTMGINCFDGVPAKNRQLQCAWPTRLGHVLNQMFGYSHWNNPLFSVKNIARGGTNTAIGTLLLEYGMLEDRYPDIIINAYSTNDMHILSMKDAENAGVTLEENVFAILQNFTRVALTMNNDPSSDCLRQPPLVIHFNDYIGNEQREIIETMGVSKAATMLSAYYGIGSASYADVVRDWVYGDTKESLFSPSGWYKNSETMKREIHPGEGMHAISAWVVVYQLLEYTSLVCSQESWFTLEASRDRLTDPLAYYPSHLKVANLPDIPAEKVPSNYLELKASPTPYGLPPLLTKQSRLDDVTALWRQQAQSVPNKPECSVSSSSLATSSPKCIFGWLSGTWPSATQEEVERMFNQRASTMEWFLSNDHNKLGWMPNNKTKLNGKAASMVLDLPNIPQSISRVTGFILKSYGQLWHTSMAKVEVYQQRDDNDPSWGSPIASGHWAGFHAKNTSEIYPEFLNANVVEGANLRVNITLLSGESYKLMGLFLC